MTDTLSGLDLARKVLRIEAAAILGLVDRINGDFEHAVQLLYDCKGRVIVTGMGKSGLICRKIAATLSSTGTSAWFLHPAEAIHGDLGAIRERRCRGGAVAQRGNRRTDPAAGVDPPHRRTADRDHRQSGLDPGARGRRDAQLRHREGSVPDEPRADGEHDGGARASATRWR